MNVRRAGFARINNATAFAAAVGFALAAPAAALAAQDAWRPANTSLAANARDAGPSHNNFTSSAARSDGPTKKIRAGAHYAGGWTQYAGFAEAFTGACHDYNSTQNLGPLIENPHSVSQSDVAAVSGYGGTPGSSCSPGSARAARASAQQVDDSALTTLKGQFALLRAPSSAVLPDRIAALVGASSGSSSWAITTASGRGWVVSVGQQLCLAVPDPIEGFGATCSPVADVAQRGLWLRIGGARADGKGIDTLVAPDDTKVVTRDGSAVATDLGVSSRVIPESDTLAVRR